MSKLLLSFSLLLAAISFAAAAPAATPTTASAHRPKLVLAIAIDQFRYDYLTRYRSEYTGGLARHAGSGQHVCVRA